MAYYLNNKQRRLMEGKVREEEPERENNPDFWNDDSILGNAEMKRAMRPNADY
jgi:hypothetical protein